VLLDQGGDVGLGDPAVPDVVGGSPAGPAGQAGLHAAGGDHLDVGQQAASLLFAQRVEHIRRAPVKARPLGVALGALVEADEHVLPKIVSDLLGHSQIGITLDLYSHVTATMQAVAAEAMGRLLGGRKHHLCDTLWAVAGQSADGRLRPVASTLSPCRINGHCSSRTTAAFSTCRPGACVVDLVVSGLGRIPYRKELSLSQSSRTVAARRMRTLWPGLPGRSLPTVARSTSTVRAGDEGLNAKRE